MKICNDVCMKGINENIFCVRNNLFKKKCFTEHKSLRILSIFSMNVFKLLFYCQPDSQHELEELF